jgi:transcriptional antiterminator RfaH
MPWAVVVTKPNHEAIAASNLQRQGFSFYYPRFKSQKPGKPAVIRPLFPRYIFVMVEQLWRSLNGTRGVSYVLMGEGGPQIIPDRIIDTIKAREDEKGLFQLVAPPKFVTGAKVKASEGPLEGLELIYEGMVSEDRVKVLANLLGRSVVVTLEEKLLSAA